MPWPRLFTVGCLTGDEARNINDTECSPVAEVKTLHISSIILAARSHFFYELVNGMRESQQRDVTLKINASEEAAFMEVLYFMYSHTLRANTAPKLVDVLILADKFEVTSCVRYCCKLMQKLSMSLECALRYLELPSSLLVNEAVKPLIDASKQYLVEHFINMDKSHGELMSLPLSALEAVLSSDGLQVKSEDKVVNFILKWAPILYPEPEERRAILIKCLVQFIHFPYLSCQKLKEVLDCPDIDHEHEVCKLVLDALFLKAEGLSAKCGLVERAYHIQPVKRVSFELSRPYLINLMRMC